MQIRTLNDDPYSKIICNYFAVHFNKAIVPNAKELLDILTIIIVGDKNIRLGAAPDPEQLVVIRQTISKSIELNLPIPILIAWGGRKTDINKGVDVAEIAAIYQIMRLDDNIKKYYPQGIYVNIRIEDTGADWIYREESEDVFERIEAYSSQFTDIVKQLSKGKAIHPVRESWLMKRDAYFDVSSKYSVLIADVIKWKMLLNEDISFEKMASLGSMAQLISLGWKGELPMKQISHYIERYKVLYPGKSMDKYIIMAADYLGGAKARYDLNGRGNPDTEVGSFISISFIPPIPGSPVSMFNNVLYYRTVPMNQGRTHIAPWRAKGYLEIEIDNSVSAKVTSWSNTQLIEGLTPAQVEIVFEGKTIVIDVDYFVKDFPMPFMI